MANQSIASLRAGDRITPVRPLMPQTLAQWDYASECATIGGGLLPGSDLVVQSVRAGPDRPWVRVEIPRRDPPAYLKIPGEMFGANFRVV